MVRGIQHDPHAAENLHVGGVQEIPQVPHIGGGRRVLETFCSQDDEAVPLECHREFMKEVQALVLCGGGVGGHADEGDIEVFLWGGSNGGRVEDRMHDTKHTGGRPPNLGLGTLTNRRIRTRASPIGADCARKLFILAFWMPLGC